jgi:flagellar motor protein MotB
VREECKEWDFYTSMMEKDGIIYGAIGGRDGGGSFAVKVGADDDATESHRVWESPDQSSYASPVVHNDMMFFVSRGMVNAIDAKTGERVKRARLTAPATKRSESSESGDSEPPARSSRRGGGRSSDYSSPVIANDKMYYIKRNGEMYVFSTDKELKQIAVNVVSEKSEEEFSATPAISDGQIFIRSNKCLYCVEAEANKKDQ